MAYTGTYDVASLLASSEPVLNLDFARVAEAFRTQLTQYNAMTTEALSLLAEMTTERDGAYGAPQAGEMQEQDEYGQGTTNVDIVYGQVDYPLRLYTHPVGWTSTWMAEATAADMAGKLTGAEKAHSMRIRTELQRAIFIPTNYVFTDHLKDNRGLNVKRLLNADSAPIPSNQYGNAFDGATHSHYMATATFTAADAQAALDNLTEHDHGNDVRIIISSADQGQWESATGFVKYDSANIIAATNRDSSAKKADSLTINRQNRAIGTFFDAEVWVKPWGMNGRSFIYAAGDSEKVLRFREPEQSTRRGLRLIPLTYDHPLYVDQAEAIYGIGAHARTNGVVWQHNSAIYTVPTIARN